MFSLLLKLLLGFLLWSGLGAAPAHAADISPISDRTSWPKILWQAATGKTVRLVLTGDIMVHADQLAIAKTSGGYDFSAHFAPVRSLLRGDMLIGNLETVLGGPQWKYTGYPSFNTPDTLADALKDAGFNVLLLANNHILDLGAEAALRTESVLRNKGFAVTGLGKKPAPPLLCEVQGLRVGILNYTYGSNRPLTPKLAENVSLNVIDPARMAEDVLTLRGQGAQYIIAALHWGIEYDPVPSPAQRAVANLCLTLGVDAVVGAHPHILQPVEIHTEYGKPQLVAWSLGNFVSAQRTVPRERSMVLALELALPAPGQAPCLLRVEAAPTWVDLSPLRGIARILPARPGQEDRDTASTLTTINQEFRAFLKLPPLPDKQGFYTLYRASMWPGDWLPWRMYRLLTLFLPTTWLENATIRARIRKSPPAASAPADASYAFPLSCPPSIPASASS